MVRVKFIAHPRTPVVSPRFSLMASETAADTSAERRESSAEQPDTSVADDQALTSMKVTSN
jgi:hypothetical protein